MRPITHGTTSRITSATARLSAEGPALIFDDVADLEGSLFDHEFCDDAAVFVHFRFQTGSDRGTIRIGLQFDHCRLQIEADLPLDGPTDIGNKGQHVGGGCIAEVNNEVGVLPRHFGLTDPGSFQAGLFDDLSSNSRFMIQPLDAALCFYKHNTLYISVKPSQSYLLSIPRPCRFQCKGLRCSGYGEAIL